MSTDATPEIAERLADVYIRDVHHGHAEPSRELAASRSSGDWILILDADERMSDLLKEQLRSLVEGTADGYWIRKTNLVDGVETGTIHHYRLVRKSRVRFDPGPHGGANAVSDNVERFDEIGIVHEKTLEEQLYDDARYERLAMEEDSPTSSKRNWLSHNHALRDARQRGRRADLETLVPPDAARALVVGDLAVELPASTVVRVDVVGATDKTGFDAAVVATAGNDALTTLSAVAQLLRPGGVVVGTAPAARNRRRIEAVIAGALSGEVATDGAPGTTRRDILDALAAAGFDAKWTHLVRDGWLDPVALRPDGSGAVVESDEFLLKSVQADAAEEMSATEIIFAGARPIDNETPECSIVLVALAGVDPQPFADAMRATGVQHEYELVVVRSESGPPVADAISVPVDEVAGMAARWNAGARAASGDLVVFAPAHAVPAPGWLDALVDTYRSRPDAGAVGSKVVATDDAIDHAGLVLAPDQTPYRIYQGDAATAPHVNRPRIMSAVAADGMLTSRAEFVSAGGFDETLGDDLADADYCLRLRARGRPSLYAPRAALHVQSRAVPGSRSGFRRSAREFATRWSRTAFRSDVLVCTADGRDANDEWNRAWPLPRPSVPSTGDLPAVAWTSHFLEQGGYTEEAIAAVEAIDDAGMYVVAQPVAWDRRGTPAPAGKAERLTTLLERDLPDDFVHVAHIGANRFKRHPAAMYNVGRTMFETDGLPPGWRDRCNAMDEVWVPSEHNLHTFANAGVAPAKLHFVGETFDSELFDPTVEPLAVEGLDGFVFLSVFSWIGRKAWDILLRAWYEEFGAQDDVTLMLKADTNIAAPGTNCRQEIDNFVRGQLKRDPARGPRVVVMDRQLDAAEMPRLYRTADAFVLASRGEGWGRPQMEAMAMGLPTVATRWSGNLEFMNDDNSYLVGYQLVDAPPDSWMLGQRWADPSVKELRRAMRRIYEHRDEAAATGARAREDVLVSCRPELVAEAVRERLDAIDRHPVHVPGAPPQQRARTKSGRRLTACVIVHDDHVSPAQCLASVAGVADATVVVETKANDDMASVRNDALDRATGGWVLMLDATQTLDPGSVGLVRQLVDNDEFVGYAARELHQFGFDGAVSAVEQRTAILFPRHPDLRYVGRVGEQLLPQREGMGFRLAPTTLIVHQHDHQRHRYDPVTRARRDLSVLEGAVRDDPYEPFHMYNFGAALERLGLAGEAEVALQRAIELAPPGATWAPSAFVSLSRAIAAQGRTAEAAKLGKKATKLAPHWAQGWCFLGALLIDAGRLKAALRAYNRALDCVAATGRRGGDPDDAAWLARAGLGRIHLGRGEYAEAAECLGDAVALSPNNAELRVWLARAADALGHSADARAHLDRATSIARTGADAYIAFSDFFTRKAEQSLLRGLADNPESRALLERIERLRASRALG